MGKFTQNYEKKHASCVIARSILMYSKNMRDFFDIFVIIFIIISILNIN